MEEALSAPSPPSAAESTARDSLRRRVWEGLAIGLLALTLNLAGNGWTSLWDRDEPRYAGCVREMRARGDWLHPTFNGEPRYQKPILIYWLMRMGLAIGGDNPFGARLVSAVAGTATCLAVWALGRRMLGARAGWLGALMLATAPIMVVESKLATTDATLALTVVGCQFCLWELGRRPSRAWALGFWVLLALATLVKGPVGPALVAASGLMAWWWGGPAVCWKRLHWRWGLAVFLVLTAPWYVTVGVLSQGDFFRVAVGQQVMHRLASGVEEHGGFPGYYLVTAGGVFHPWSALVPAAFWGAWVRRKGRPEFGFLLGWAVGPMVLLECVQTKLVHYYLPAYPACTLLAAWLVGALVKEEVNLRRWPLGRVGTGMLGGVGIGGAVALVAGAIVLPSGLRWPCLTLGLVMGAGTLYALERFLKGATERAVAGLVATWAVMMLGLGGWLLPATEPYKISFQVADRLAAHAAALNAQPVLMSFQEPSVVYAFGRPVHAIKTWPELCKLLEEKGEVITAVLPKELNQLRAHARDVEFEVRERFQGFNISKGQSQTVSFVVLRPKETASARLSRAGLEQVLIK